MASTMRSITFGPGLTCLPEVLPFREGMINMRSEKRSKRAKVLIQIRFLFEPQITNTSSVKMQIYTIIARFEEM
jgi:hypothetical protein